MAAPDTPKRRWPALLVAAIVVVLLGAVGGPYVYIHFIEAKAPPALAVTCTAPGSSAPSGASLAPAEGTWKATAGSQAGYRVKEVLFGQSAEAAGRTSHVTGTMTLAGTKVTTASFTVDMTTVTSDRGGRDSQFQGRIMDTASFPTSSFTLTSPIALASIPTGNVAVKAAATGKLMLHGVTRPVTFTVTASRCGSTIQAAGAIPITFVDWQIANPSGGPASVGSSGTLEFLIVFARA